ncbi:hypothetical protein BN988_03634 [Oceanobacillus picturae]|jgi:uncharacterized integral membrane protein (TIGR02327 family)|uniref:DUF1146 domain-containing protein n=1 Tax=Oceanobacillus picturae TaxID=171693 RepID=W9AHZ3_9BACI|nr:DUF1146 family protein [Oceanobacillus picturae]RIU94982.1 DUF1146 domain-containing protein [Oceanobacillus picturae]CDO05053.1 hypothetical protein BN988_03634 [Oceanobacillus picturae]
MFSIGQLAIVSMISHLIFIYLTWRVVQAINFDPLIRKGRAAEARVLLLLVTIVVGAGVSRFFLEILQWSSDLIYLF